MKRLVRTRIQGRQRIVTLVGIGVALLLATPGCGGSTDDAHDADAAPAPAAKLSVVDARVFRPMCTGPCHSGGENAGGGLDMSKNLHAVLVGVPATAVACADGATLRVAAGDPEASLLYRKIAARIERREPGCGEPMPMGEERPAVSAADAELVRAWIAAGARDD